MRAFRKLRPRNAIVWLLFCLSLTLAVSSEGRTQELFLCKRINAKQMPTDFAVPVMTFSGPAGDGRRGSAGFVFAAKEGQGTQLSFSFHRDPSGYGFQIIHPLGKGHVLVSVQSRGVTIHRGGNWGVIGWGNPAGSETLKSEIAANILPLKANVTLQFVSRLSSDGRYQLSVNDKIVCRHAIGSAQPLVLQAPKDKRFWGGSSWNRAQFTGDDFNSELRPGNVGLILGPMDGSGPNQNFQNVRLTLLSSRLAVANRLPATEYEPIFRSIDNAREFGKLKKSRLAGGSGGGPFSESMGEPSLLVGFEYTLSRFYGGHLTVKSLRPIFQTRGGERLGSWRGSPHGKVYRLKAKPGYAATALIAKHGHRIDGIRLLFMKVRGGRLNPDDSYRSDWIGGHGGGGETLYGDYGNPIVSIFGRTGRDIDSIGLLQAELR